MKQLAIVFDPDQQTIVWTCIFVGLPIHLPELYGPNFLEILISL
jgi:hypothetical protein